MSEHIPTDTALFPLADNLGHYRVWVQKLSGYVAYRSSISVTLHDYTFPEISEHRGIMNATACVVVSHTLLNGGVRDVYQDSDILV